MTPNVPGKQRNQYSVWYRWCHSFRIKIAKVASSEILKKKANAQDETLSKTHMIHWRENIGIKSYVMMEMEILQLKKEKAFFEKRLDFLVSQFKLFSKLVHALKKEQLVTERLLTADYNYSRSVKLLLRTDLTIQLFNKAARKISQVFFDETLETGTNILDFLNRNSGEKNENFAQNLHECLRKAIEGEHVSQRVRVNVNDGFEGIKELWIRLICYPLYDFEHTLIGISVEIAYPMRSFENNDSCI